MNSPRQWDLWAHDSKTHFIDIGSKRYVELHGPEPVVPVRITEDPEGQYWGWLATGETTPCMIWPSKMQFNMCFAYGPQAEVEKGQGVPIQLKCEAHPTQQ